MAVRQHSDTIGLHEEYVLLVQVDGRVWGTYRIPAKSRSPR
ncbi:hypothetical protein [Streptomyces sp. SYP-A7185]